MVDTFQAAIGGKFATLLIYNGNSEIDEAITTYEAAIVETAGGVLGSLSCVMQHRGFDPPLSLR